MTSPDILQGWDQISTYLGWLDSATVRSWCADPLIKRICPVPVFRHPSGRTVLSTRSQLDEWVRNLVELATQGKVPNFMEQKMRGKSVEAECLPLFSYANMAELTE